MQLTWRITSVRQKVLFIVLGYAAIALIFFALRTWVLDADSVLYACLSLVVTVSYTVLGVRIFRGYQEPISPPRLWWRWTGRPKAGFWLGALYAFALIGAFDNLWPRHGTAPHLASAIVAIVDGVIPGAGYLNSSFRLRLHPEMWSSVRPRRVQVPPGD